MKIHKKRYFEKAIKNETKGILEISYIILYGEHFADEYHPNKNIYKTPEDSLKDQNGLLEKNDIGFADEDFDKVYKERKKLANELEDDKFEYQPNQKNVNEPLYNSKEEKEEED